METVCEPKATLCSRHFSVGDSRCSCVDRDMRTSAKNAGLVPTHASHLDVQSWRMRWLIFATLKPGFCMSFFFIISHCNKRKKNAQTNVQTHKAYPTCQKSWNLGWKRVRKRSTKRLQSNNTLTWREGLLDSTATRTTKNGLSQVQDSIILRRLVGTSKADLMSQLFTLATIIALFGFIVTTECSWPTRTSVIKNDIS